MTRYIAKRVAAMLVVLLSSSLLVFACLHLAPGDPAKILLAGRPVTEQSLQAVRDKYGLDRPLPEQYLTWVDDVIHGDLGESIKGRDSVVNVLKPRLGTTLMLTVYAMALVLLIGVPLGVLSAVYRRGWVDVTSSVGALVLASIPAYVTGIALISIFAVSLGWFPALGGGNGGLESVYYLTLPAIALAMSAMAMLSRVTRLSMLETLGADFVETARIRGFSAGRVVGKHAFRSALIPVVTIAGVLVGYLLSGAVLVEYAFSINGIGSLLVSSVQGLDYAVVQAIALLATLAFVTINLFVDILCFVIDPRIRAGQGGVG